MNTEEMEAIEAQLRTLKPRSPSDRVYQQVFPRRREDDDAVRVSWLVWFGPAVAAVIMLGSTPVFLGQSAHVAATNGTNIACLATGELVGDFVRDLRSGPSVNIWHTATLATTNYGQ